MVFFVTSICSYHPSLRVQLNMSFLVGLLKACTYALTSCQSSNHSVADEYGCV